MVVNTLEKMRIGGIYDQIGHGFHRYSTDREWAVPHFEKMLIDQAFMLTVYTEAYVLTSNPLFKHTALELADFLKNNLRSPNGTFYTAIDADINGREGLYYLWKREEFLKVLDTRLQNIALKIFRFKRLQELPSDIHESNQEIRYVLTLADTPDRLADSLKMSTSEFVEVFEEIRRRLHQVREKRPKPSLDDKVLTDWNGMVIAALSIAGRYLHNENLLDLAIKCANETIKNRIKPNGSVLHYKSSTKAIPGFLDDYAYLINGLITLYQSVFKTKYLEYAVKLANYVIENFWDNSDGGFYFTEENHNTVPFRGKEFFEGGYPSGNSVMLSNLVMLGMLTGNLHYLEIANDLITTLSPKLKESPQYLTWFLLGLDLVLNPTYEVVLAGDTTSPVFKEMLTMLKTSYLPNSVIMVRPDPPDFPDICRVSSFTKDLRAKDAKPTAYVCQNFVCDIPINDPKKLKSIISSITQ